MTMRAPRFWRLAGLRTSLKGSLNDADNVAHEDVIEGIIGEGKIRASA